MSNWFTRVAAALICAVFWVAGSGVAMAASPVGVSPQLKICNLPDGAVLPNSSGQFVCPNDNDYSGNAGKNWNELDLVPLRIELNAGNSAPASQTYTLASVVDREDVTRPGYDVLSVPVLNTRLSHASCQAVSAGPSTQLAPGIGGTDISLYRLLTFTQSKNTTCVYDYYARLALGSSLYPGASLHANLMNESFGTAGIGAQDRSIPVREISPQSLAKDMTASQGSDHAWNVTKSATTNNLGFGDVCRANAPTSLPVSITVTWTKFAAVPGGPITVITNVYATNPAARAITTNVTDRIYSGTNLLDTSATTSMSVPAGMTKLVLTHTYTAPAGTSNLNDVASATYTDDVTGIEVPGQTTATASAEVQNTGPALNASASIADLEEMTGNGLQFSVATPLLGAFDAPYVAGTQTTGPVGWGVTGQTGSNSVTFNKTVYLDGKRVTTGVLTDAASLVGINGFAATSGPFNINISSSATVKFTLSKSIPTILGAGEKVEVTFRVTRANDPANQPAYQRDETLTFTGGGATTQSVDLSGLAPDTYVVTETSSLFFAAGATTGVDSKLVPSGGDQKMVPLGADAAGIVSNCSGTAAFENVIRAEDYPRAQVQKTTLPALATSDPDFTWSFTLTGPDGFTDTMTAGAGAGYAPFAKSLQKEGTYFVTESTRAPAWALTSAAPEGAVDDKVCSFTVNFPQDIGATLSCTFTNTKQGRVDVVKTLNGQATTGQFTFQLRTGASGTAEGSPLETLTTNVAPNGSRLSFATWLVPNSTYQMCESVAAGWMTKFTDPNDPLFVPGAFQPPAGTIPNPNVDNSWLCVNFSVTPGQTKTISVDNSPPPGGRALTIGYWKTHASCTTSSTRKDAALDKTLFGYLPLGIPVGKVASVVDATKLGFYGQNPTSTADCAHAVSLLDKRDFGGAKKASDPLFNMAAQLVATELNLAAGAYTCPAMVTAVNTANALLTKYSFTGFGYTGTVSKPDATSANTTAAKLDDYNNNRTGVCL